MNHQNLTAIACRAMQHRPSFVVAQQHLTPAAFCTSTISRSKSAAYFSTARHSHSLRKDSLHPLKKTTFLRQPRSLLAPANSPAFSTTASTRSAVATLNPRVDDDGNQMLIEISPRAAKRLSEITASSNENQHLRVTVMSGGCHGFQYTMSLESSSKLDEVEDTVFEDTETTAEGGLARVVMDQPSLELLSGSTVDYTTELIGSQFKVNNPRATSNCGCGTSFDINL